METIIKLILKLFKRFKNLLKRGWVVLHKHKYFLWIFALVLLTSFAFALPTTTFSSFQVPNTTDQNITLTCTDNNTGCKAINYNIDNNTWILIQSSDLNIGLLHYYDLDETTGAILDKIDGNNMTNSGGLQNQTGKIGKAIRWDGARNTDGFTGFKSESKAQTMNVWVYYNSSLVNTEILAATDTGGVGDICFGYRVWGDADNTTKPYVIINNSGKVTAPNDITESAWHMLTYTWNGSNDTNGVKLYIDGVKVAEGTTNTTGLTTQDFAFGNIGIGNENSDLIIDEIGYWNKALTANAINQLYNAGTAKPYTQFGNSTDSNNYNFLYSGAGTHTIEYFSTDNADNNETIKTSTFTTYGKIRFNIYDENTGTTLTGANIDYNGTPQTLNSYYYDHNLQGITTGNYTFTFTKTGYGTRYYQVDLNQYSDFNKSIQLLSSSLGENINFRFFAPDQTTKINQQYIEVLDYNSTVFGYSLGRLKTNTTGDINFFLNLNDANIHFLLNNGVSCDGGTTTTCDYNTVILTVNKPKDEDTGIDINAAWSVSISGLASQSILNTTAATKTFALYSNTVDTYRLQVDSNSTSPVYTSRAFLLNYYGNPLTDTLQPYLLQTTYAVLTKIQTLQQDILGVTSLPGIVVKVYKNIPGQGNQLIQQIQTDGKGQGAVYLKSGDAYTFNLYQDGALLAFNQQTTIPINVITTTITFTIDATSTTPYVPQGRGVFIEWQPMDNSIKHLTTGTLDINQYLWKANGTSVTYTAALHVYIDGNELLIGGTLPKYTTSSSNTIVYNNIPWSQLPVGQIVLIMDINQSDGNTYAYSQIYNLYSTDTNISGTTYTYDILNGLRYGIKEDLGYEANDICPPLLALSLLITFGSIAILTVKMGSFGGQGTVGMGLGFLTLFTFLNWVPLELTAIAFIVGGAFIINDANLR